MKNTVNLPVIATRHGQTEIERYMIAVLYSEGHTLTAQNLTSRVRVRFAPGLNHLTAVAHLHALVERKVVVEIRQTRLPARYKLAKGIRS